MTIAKVARRTGLLLGTLLFLGGAYLGCVILSGNFHTVVAGEFYRSAQLTPQRLETYQQLYGIRTIVNLRGIAKRWLLRRDWESLTLISACRPSAVFLLTRRRICSRF
jgi:protein tyrosine/serine phosphatase